MSTMWKNVLYQPKSETQACVGERPGLSVAIFVFSVRSLSQQHCGDRHDHDPQIEARASRFGVDAVEGDPRAIADIVAAAHLPQAGDARLDRTVMLEALSVARDLCIDDRPRPDQAHRAL